MGKLQSGTKKKLQILQNRAVRVISKNYTSPIEQVFVELNLLNVQQLIDFDSAALIFKAQNGLAAKYISHMFVPSNYIHGYNTRHAMNGLFNSHVNFTYSSRICFAQTGSRLWNEIPHYVHTAKTLTLSKLAIGCLISAEADFSTCYSLLFIRYLLLFTRYLLFFTHYSLHFTRYSLFFTRYSFFFITHCFLLEHVFNQIRTVF